MVEAYYIEHPQPPGPHPPHPLPVREPFCGAISELREMEANKDISRLVSLPHSGQRDSDLARFGGTKRSNRYLHDKQEYSYIGTSLDLQLRHSGEF